MRSRLSFMVSSCLLVLAFVLTSTLPSESKSQIENALANSGEEGGAEQDGFRTVGEIVGNLKPDSGEIPIRTLGPRPNIHEGEAFRLAVPFDFNSSDLTAAAKLQLDELGKALESPEISDIRIELAGHTDERGSAEYNLNLSRRRVESAKAYLLMQFRVDASRIFEVGYGESKPRIRDATNEAEHAVNRRVEIRRLGTGEGEPEQPDLPESVTTQPMALRVQCGILRVTRDGDHELIRYDGTSTLTSDDVYRIYLRPEAECYVYIYQLDSHGKGSWLFPRTDIAQSNPLSAWDHWLPSRNNSFGLDETTGTETIYLAAAYKPLHELEACVHSTSEVMPQVVTKVIKTMGFAELRTDPGPKQETAGTSEIARMIGQSGNFYYKVEFKHE